MCWLILVTGGDLCGRRLAHPGAVAGKRRPAAGLLLKTAIPVFAVMMIGQGFAMAARAALTLSGETPPPCRHDNAGDHEL
jgi:hypothetical protein